MNLEELTKEELLALVRAQASETSTGDSAVPWRDLHLQYAELELRYRLLQERYRDVDRSRAQYAELYDFAPVAIFTVDCDARIQELNLAAGAIFSADRSALIGRPMSSLVVPDDRALVRSHLKRCSIDRVRATSEVRIAIGGLGSIPFQLVSTALLDSDRKVIGCKCALTEVSTLKRSEERLRVLARASAQFSSSFDVTGNLSHVVRMLVPTFADLAFVDVLEDGGRVNRVEVACSDPQKATVAEALKRPQIPWVDLAEPVMLTSASRAALALAVAEGPERNAIVEACDPHAIMMVPITARDRTLGVLSFVVTDSKRTYSAADLAFASDLAARVAMAIDNARLYRDAQHAIQARQDVLSIVSHDLKNPLAGIRVNADLMLKSAPPSERRKGRVQLERIKVSIAQMERLIDDLLDVGSIESGHLSIEPRDQCLQTLIRSALELLAPLAQDHGLSLEAKPLPEPIWVGCDANRVLQVFSNLIGNALKFCPAGASITVSATTHDGKAHVSVKDTGPGIAPQVLRNLFQRFWQARETASMGRGLGLFISKGIIESLGGQIWVESQMGAGTEVHFTLPLAPVPHPDVVLVVEDEESLRLTVRDILIEHGYGVVVAADGREALDYLSRGERPRLILLDLNLPIVDGREVLRTMKSDPGLAQIPVVLVSSDDRLDEERTQLGAAGSLKKPINFEQLLNAVAGRAHSPEATA